MNKRLIPVLLAFSAALGMIALGCGESPLESESPAVIDGKVLEKGSLLPLAGAKVRALPFVESKITDANGSYSLAIELADSNVTTVTLVISKAGYLTDSIPGLAIQNGHTTTLAERELELVSATDTTRTSGPASNVVLVAIEAEHIFVAGSGANETSDLIFEVRDANGTPVAIAQQALVRFKITGPQGGEFLSPESVQTDAAGRVTTTVNSGTKAGALQIVATIDNTTITSAPVPLAIHGGLPESGHFAVVSDKLNFAGYDVFGLENQIKVFLGDRYSNPVAPGTAVYFHTTGGIIEGSALTGALGTASVRLLSASPQPPGISGYPFPFSEPGFALITAQTVDENQQQITTTTVVLFSGRTQAIVVNPSSFSLEPDSAQQFQYTVHDENNNPLVGGTSITVSTNVGEVRGDASISLEDTQSRGFTNFSFVLVNSDPDSTEVLAADLEITVSSQNGNARTAVSGVMLPLQ